MPLNVKNFKEIIKLFNQFINKSTMHEPVFTITSLELLSDSKRDQLMMCPSIPHFYVSIEGWSFNLHINAAIYTIEIGLELEDQVILFYIERRYSSLYKFHRDLINDMPDIQCLKLFPPKKVFGNRDVNFIRQRLYHLQKYFSKISSLRNISKKEAFRQYFNFEKLKSIWCQKELEYQNNVLMANYINASIPFNSF
ncbi:PX domain containing protein [Tritrichomonas foetus]|uniref:PX domain containing protein n=1 Tax=Tritrichomonas foetus TaxID=1144522 RepID=A0A1J4K316_9EUKA|nr:PX domain containing protein [Tritrichomonas foetus]|eukprot:OHT05216.1 PX domain containing protein [Tritrichomonas foetus]